MPQKRTDSLVSARRFSRIPLPLLTLTALVTASPAAFVTDGEGFFESKIRPLLLERCIDCHSASKGKVKGGLDLDSRQGWATGGDAGPSIIPGEPDKSPLIDAVRYGNEDLQMPPKGKLPEHEIKLLEEWVKRGAPDPRIGAAPAAARKGIDLVAGRQFWSFRPVAAGALPAVKDHTWPAAGAAGRIDRFILARLEAAGIRPAADADRVTLLRRLSYDLTGLPPSADAVRDFLADERPEALERQVDRLLASRQFAEQWARHWLDLARYADNNGSSFNPPFREAYRYRNWVIDAIDRDMPYDQFTMRQIAGDLMPAADPSERDANLIATTYLMLGSKVLGMFEKDQLTLDVVDEQLNVIGTTFLGLTLSCARCHDHKFDPVSQKDYYALAGIFTSTITLDDRMGGPKEDESDWSRRGLGVGGDEKLRAFWAEHRYDYVKAGQKLWGARKKIDRLNAEKPNAGGVLPEKKQQELEKAVADVALYGRKLADFEAILPPMAMAPRDADQPADTALRIRGVAASLGDVVPRGFIEVASYDGQPAVNPSQSGRLELAQWIASPKHPLTSRVFVNRVWMHLFGNGIVRSPENFGVRGEPPTHPELLDDLAHRFASEGWSLKRLVREMALSRTYRMSSAINPRAAEIDPENKLFWRHERRRMSAEEIRDTILVAAGKLDASPRPGPLLRHLPYSDISGDDVHEFARAQDDRRTIYQPVARDYLMDVLDAFDFANPSMSIAQRPQTTVAPQALYWMNSTFVAANANAMAKRIAADEPSRDVEAIVRRAFVLACQREPTAGETKVLGDYLRTQFEGPPGPTDHDIGKLCQALLASTPFQFIE